MRVRTGTGEGGVVGDKVERGVGEEEGRKLVEEGSGLFPQGSLSSSHRPTHAQLYEKRLHHVAHEAIAHPEDHHRALRR